MGIAQLCDEMGTVTRQNTHYGYAVRASAVDEAQVGVKFALLLGLLRIGVNDSTLGTSDIQDRFSPLA